MTRYIGIMFSAVCLLSSVSFADDFAAYKNYAYDPNDFAVEVIAWNPGTGIVIDWLNDELINNPLNALGRPTIDTTGEDWLIQEEQICPVNPVYAPFRSFELVCLGRQGSIILGFNSHVRDDVNNPYGIDFIVFGNAQQEIGNQQGWSNGNPAAMKVIGSGILESAVVSVSQDGVIWYSFTNDVNFMSGDANFIKFSADSNDGPFADDFAPTLGRVYDPNHPDANIGSWNLWWSYPTNPTLPIDPSLAFESFDTKTVAQICQTYGYSAGGTGFDIGRLDLPVDQNSGLKWFQYVRIDSSAENTPEIDAVSDVKGCQDCRINFQDFAELAKRWENGLADIEDLKNLSDRWLMWSWE
ncbi:MAG: hypothetical protein WC770_05750 [Phycisphaerae bacterium]